MVEVRPCSLLLRRRSLHVCLSPRGHDGARTVGLSPTPSTSSFWSSLLRVASASPSAHPLVASMARQCLALSGLPEQVGLLHPLLASCRCLVVACLVRAVTTLPLRQRSKTCRSRQAFTCYKVATPFTVSDLANLKERLILGKPLVAPERDLKSHSKLSQTSKS